MIKTLILLILFSALISCQTNKKQALPKSEFYNMQVSPSSVIFNRLDLIQFDKDSVKIAYVDTNVYPIDSNLHSNIFQKIGTPIEFNNSFIATLSFDKETPYETILIIKNELRKLGFYNICLLTTDNKAIRYRLAPLSDIEKKQRHYLNRQNHLLPLSPPNRVQDSSNFTLTITNKTSNIQIVNSQLESVNMYEELIQKEDLILRLNMRKDNTYQEYVDVLAYVFKTYRMARAKQIVENGLTQQEANKKYPLRMR